MNSFNYSAISTSRRCNKLYQHLYVDKLVSDDQPSGDMAFGTAIHLAVEACLEKDDPIKSFDLFWNIEKNRNNRYGRYGWEDLQTQGHILLDRFKRLHAKKFNIHQMEQRLYGSIGKIRVEGTPDFIGDFEGKKTIVDFKTSGSRYNKDRILISEQLLLYAHLARQSLNYQAEQVSYIIFIKGKDPSIQCLSAPLAQCSLESVCQDIEVTCQELIVKENNKYFTKNLANCIMGEVKCSFWKRCHNVETKEQT